MKKHFTCANTALSTPPCNSHRVGTISSLILALMLGFSANAVAGGTVYFKNVGNWSKIYIYMYSSETYYKDGVGCQGNGVGGEKATAKGEMTLYSGTGADAIYKYDYTTKYANIAFEPNGQTNYGQFHNNSSVVYTITFTDVNKPLYTPDLQNGTSCNGCTYYLSGSWAALPAPDPCPNCKTITK